MGEQVEELLNREENKVLLDGLVEASERVEKAKRELAEIERQEIEAKLAREYINKLETRASEVLTLPNSHFNLLFWFVSELGLWV